MKKTKVSRMIPKEIKRKVKNVTRTSATRLFFTLLTSKL